MTRVEPLYLSRKDIEFLESKKYEIGRGTDGVVYRSPNPKEKDILLKIYLKSFEELKNPNYKVIYDAEGVNIANNKEFFRKIRNPNRYKITYFNKEGLKLNGIEAVYQAIERQPYIKNTHLQKKPIYIDGHFGGTILHYHRHHTAIANLRLFPKQTQINVLKKLVVAVKELLDNNIYHIDLGLKPETQFREANVLISLSLNPIPAIIDIDGKSAIYTESFNQNYYQMSLRSLKDLIVGLLFDIEAESLDDLDIDFLEDELLKMGVEVKYIRPILDPEFYFEIPEINDFLDSIKLIKK